MYRTNQVQKAILPQRQDNMKYSWVEIIILNLIKTKKKRTISDTTSRKWFQQKWNIYAEIVGEEAWAKF